MTLALALLVASLPVQAHSGAAPDRAQFTSDGHDWIATFKGKTLWKEPLGYSRRADSDHYASLTSRDVLLVSTAGKIVARFPKTGASDPKSMVFCGDIFIYTTENWVGGMKRNIQRQAELPI